MTPFDIARAKLVRQALKWRDDPDNFKRQLALINAVDAYESEAYRRPCAACGVTGQAHPATGDHLYV